MSSIHGSGREAGILETNRLKESSVTTTLDRKINSQRKHWKISFDKVMATLFDDVYFFYLINTGTVNLSITDITMICAIDTNIEVRAPIGTLAKISASDFFINVVSSNLGSGDVLDANIEFDELGNFGSPFDENGTLFHMPCKAGVSLTIDTASDIIIPPQALFTLFMGDTGGGQELSTIINIMED